MTTMNPFLVQSTLPYLAPHFDQIANHHYRPAFDEGMQQKRTEIAAIALNPQTPDFNNTILALEQSGELLTRVTSVFFAMTAAHRAGRRRSDGKGRFRNVSHLRHNACCVHAAAFQS